MSHVLVTPWLVMLQGCDQCYRPQVILWIGLLMAATTAFFALGATAYTVIATATWLVGCLSHSSIVSKRLNLSENLFDHLKAPSL